MAKKIVKGPDGRRIIIEKHGSVTTVKPAPLTTRERVAKLKEYVGPNWKDRNQKQWIDHRVRSLFDLLTMTPEELHARNWKGVTPTTGEHQLHHAMAEAGFNSAARDAMRHLAAKFVHHGIALPGVLRDFAVAALCNELPSRVAGPEVDLAWRNLHVVSLIGEAKRLGARADHEAISEVAEATGLKEGTVGGIYREYRKQLKRFPSDALEEIHSRQLTSQAIETD